MKPKLITSLAFSVLSFLLANNFLNAQDTTYITGGTITQDSTWTKDQSPYLISGDVIVDNGITLTIEPGVEVLFERYDIQNTYSDPERCEIIIRGNFICIGNESDSIYFNDKYKVKDDYSWRQINISGSDNSKVDIEYCVIENSSAESIWIFESDTVITNISEFISICVSA